MNPNIEKEPLRRRCSTPTPPFSHHLPRTWDPRLSSCSQTDPENLNVCRSHPPLGQSASYHPGDKSLHYRAQWSSDSDSDSHSDSDCVYRVVLLGDHGVGKTSLAGIFAGVTEREEHPGDDTYERTLTVDGEDATLVVMDTWQTDKLIVCSSSGFHERQRPNGQWCRGGCGHGPRLLPEGWECLRHRLLRHRPLQLRLCRGAAHHPEARPPGRKPSHHPRGEQERPGPGPRGGSGRGPSVRRGLRL
ncbi:GTP-binding protein REM 1-like isoform X2 [Oryzias latipes]